MRIDERHHEERTETPAERGNRKLERFARRTARAAVVFGQMPLYNADKWPCVLKCAEDSIACPRPRSRSAVMGAPVRQCLALARAAEPDTLTQQLFRRVTWSQLSGISKPFPIKDEAFESFYGADGDWTKLSRRSRSFLGSSFLKDLAHPEHYVLVEYWSEMLVYEKHLADFDDELHRLEELRQRSS